MTFNYLVFLNEIIITNTLGWPNGTYSGHLTELKEKVDLPRFLSRKPGGKYQDQWLMAILCRFQGLGL